MSFALTCQTILLDIRPEDAWTVWSDLASYPEWDPREEVNRPNGPLAVGMTGTFKQRGRGAGTYKVTSVEIGRRWVSETALPGGKLIIDHVVQQVPQGTELTKTYVVKGPMAIAFRLFFARGIRREMPISFAALETEIKRRLAGKIQSNH